MPFELFIAFRYLLARRKQAFISVISIISTLGVAVGVMALIIALALMTGLQEELRDRILGSTAHVYVWKTGGIEDYQAEVRKMLMVPGVIGAGPIGCEFAQSFARFGSQVYLIDAVHGILPKEDRDAAEIVERQMLRDGVKLLCSGKDLKVSGTYSGKRLTVDSQGQQHDVTVDEILVGVGRTPNVEGNGQETVGID